MGMSNGKIVVYNESNVNLQLGWDGFTTYCPAWTAMLYCVNASSVNISWIAQSTLNAGGAPISQVLVEAYTNTETITGTYPAALVRSTNIGNASSVGGTASSIANTGNAPGSNLISAQPTDASSPTWSADISGNLTVNSDDAGVLTTLLQLIAGASPTVKLAAAGLLTEVLGTLQVDGNNISGPASGNLNLISPNSIFFQIPLGTNVFAIESGGPVLKSGNLSFLSGSVSRIKGGKAVSVGANSTVTVTHGLGAQPTLVLISCDNGSTTSTSATRNYTSTTFDIYSYSACSYDWLAIAF